MITQRLEKLRGLMSEHHIHYYIIPTNDYHLSEYVGDYFCARKYMSGFTGSAGVLLVGRDTAGLWTDGRYYIQAERQLEGSTITLFRQGSEGVPLMEDYLKSVLKNGENIGFDGRVMPAQTGEELEDYVTARGGHVIYDMDLVGEIWEERPSLSNEKAYILEEKYAGESALSKLGRVRKAMAEKKADYHVLTSLDDIAWLLNIRGNDVPCNPVVLSYGVISMDGMWLFAD